MIDSGPDSGVLNRTVLRGYDYFITPLSPDLFLIKETQNPGISLLFGKMNGRIICINGKI